MEQEWLKEKDKYFWIDEKTQFKCMILRNNTGALCGYVGIPPQSKKYEEFLSVHGGITFYKIDYQESFDSPDYNDLKSCDIYGFDCSHAGDYCPKSAEMYPEIFFMCDGIYRNYEYVKNEVASLAEQLQQLLLHDESKCESGLKLPHTIGEIGNYYGCLKLEGEKDSYFWGIESYDGMFTESIPNYLAEALIKFETERKKK